MVPTRRGGLGLIRNKGKGEQGATLVTIIIIFSILSIIGITLFGMISNSQAFVSKEKTNLTDRTIAENAINEGIAQIETKSENLSVKGLTPSAALKEIDQMLNSIKSLGEYKYTISHETIRDGKDDGIIVKEITVEANIGESGKKITRKMMLSTIAEIFQYSLFTPTNLTLNGAPYLEGDFYVGGNINTRNEAKWISSGVERRLPTSYAALNGYLTVKNKYYYYFNGWKEFTADTQSLNQFFSIAPFLRDRKVIVTKIDVSNLINEKKDEPIIIGDKNHYKDIYHSFSNTHTFDSSVKGNELTIKNGAKVTINGNLYLTSNLYVESGGELTIKGNVYVGGNLKIDTFKKENNKTTQGGKLIVDGGSMKVNGSATLGHSTYKLHEDHINQYGTIILTSKKDFLYINKDTSIRNFNFTGQMYVNENVIINGDFNTNGTAYVKKTATIEDFSNYDGTLILVADENVQIANNNLYNDEPKVLHAYFYSNKQLEIYGVGSHLKIIGGIYGQPIILNAAKGKTKNGQNISCENGFDKHYDLCFEKAHKNLPPEKSRLSIIYNENMILNPPTGIPTTDKLQLKYLYTKYERK